MSHQQSCQGVPRRSGPLFYFCVLGFPDIPQEDAGFKPTLSKLDGTFDLGGREGKGIDVHDTPTNNQETVEQGPCRVDILCRIIEGGRDKESLECCCCNLLGPSPPSSCSVTHPANTDFGSNLALIG